MNTDATGSAGKSLGAVQICLGVGRSPRRAVRCDAGGWFRVRAEGAGGLWVRRPEHTTAPPRKPHQTKRRAFPNRAHFATVHRIQRGLAPMIVLVGVALLVAMLAFAFVPLAMGRAAQTLTRWLTGRN